MIKIPLALLRNVKKKKKTTMSKIFETNFVFINK